MAEIDFSLTAKANGTIYPARAIKQDTTTNFCVLQATDGVASAGDVCIGIATMAFRDVPYTAPGIAQTVPQPAAYQNDPIKYFGNGAKDIPAELGNSCTAGQELKADPNGKLIPVTTSGDHVVAISKMAGAAGDLIDVDVTIRDKS